MTLVLIVPYVVVGVYAMMSRPCFRFQDTKYTLTHSHTQTQHTLMTLGIVSPTQQTKDQLLFSLSFSLSFSRRRLSISLPIERALEWDESVAIARD